MNSIDVAELKFELQKLVNSAAIKKTTLKKQRDNLDRDIQEIEEDLISYEKISRFIKKYSDSYLKPEAISLSEGEVIPALDPLKNNKFENMTVPTALVRFFYDRDNVESSVSKIFEYVTANGLEIGGKDPVANLTAVLHADKRFEAVRRGVYRLEAGVFNNLKESGPKYRFRIEII
jgi:effector-binding domain-containing protein